MANKCKLDLDAEVKRISKLVAKATTSESALAKLEKMHKKDKRIKKVQARVLKHAAGELEENLRELVSVNDRLGLDKVTVERLKGAVQREIIDIFNTYKAIGHVLDIYNKINVSGAKADYGTVKGAIQTLFQRVSNNTVAEEVKYDRLVEDIFDNLDTSGTQVDLVQASKAKGLFYEHRQGGRQLIEFLKEKGLSDNEIQKEIFMALSQGSHRTINELHIIAKAVKEVDIENSKYVLDNSPYFNILADHTLPHRMDIDKLKAVGEQEFIDDMLDAVDVTGLTKKYQTDQALIRALKEYRNVLTDDNPFIMTSNYKSSVRLFGSRKFHFKTKKKEWDILQKYGRGTEDVLNQVVNHKRNLRKNVALYQSLGPKIGLVMNELANHIAEVNPNVTLKQARDLVDINSTLLKNRMGRQSKLEGDHAEVATTLQNIIKYAFTGFSAIRDIVGDQTVITGATRALIKNGYMLKEVPRATWQLLKHTYNGKKTDYTLKMMERQGIIGKIQQHILYSGHSDTVAANANVGKGSLAEKVRKASDWAVETQSKLTLADRINRSSRASNYIETSNLLHEILTHKTEMSRAMIGYLEQAGLTVDEFRLLNKVDRLEYEGQVIGLDIESLGKHLTDAELSKFTKALETPKDVLQRLRQGYLNLHTELTNTMTALTSHRGTLAVELKEGGGIIGEFLKHILRFSNIGVSQWVNYHRAMLLSKGLDPNTASSFKQGYIGLAKKAPIRGMGAMIGTFAASGYMINWANDLWNGETVRDINAKNTAEALIAGGFGGWYGWLYAQWIYNRGAVGSPLGSMVRESYNLAQGGKTSKRAAARAGQKFIPFLNMWYTRKGAQMLLRDGLDIPQVTPSERRRRRERGQKDLIREVKRKL